MKTFVALLLIAVPSASLAQTMNAETFYKRATKVQNKGALAVFSMGEVKLLMKEGQAAAARAKALRLGAEKAGAKPRYCPPAGPQSMDSNEFMKRLATIPAAERTRIDMTEATMRILAA